jgi:hypothetical protein
MASPNSTLDAIRTKVRRLTASPDEEQLSTADIDEYINTFYTQDFPYAIKIGQLKSVIEFFTTPNIDVYPLDGTLPNSLDEDSKDYKILEINNLQGIRDPVYVQGCIAKLYKSRASFYSAWPRCGDEYRPLTVTRITPNPNTYTFNIDDTPLLRNSITLSIKRTNPNLSLIQIKDDGAGNLYRLDTQNGVGTVDYLTGEFSYNDAQAGYSAETVTGQAENNTDGTAFYTIVDLLAAERAENPNAYLVPKTVTVTIDPGGPNETIYTDDGNGNMTLTSGPYTIASGIVDYISGQVILNFTVLPPAGETVNSTFQWYDGKATLEFTVFASSYKPSRPVSMLFFNNKLVLRPVPDEVYKVEFEAFLTPVQFIASTDNPILKQWYQYIALGAAEKVLQDRGDFEGLELVGRYKAQQEALVLEREAVNQIGQRNATVFTNDTFNYGYDQW